MHYICACVVLAVTTVLTGCGGTPPLTISAAASLRQVLPPLAPQARFGLAGSDTLAAQIREGAPVDVVVLADPRQMERLRAAGIVGEPATIATNRLTIIAPRSNPAALQTVTDIARPDLRLVLAHEGVPAGRYARAALTTLGLQGALANVVSNEDSVTGVVAKVRLGEADAGIVYVTDAMAAGTSVVAIGIPTRAQPSILYQAAVLTRSRRADEAAAFVALLRSDRGRSALVAAGFGPAPSPAPTLRRRRSRPRSVPRQALR